MLCDKCGAFFAEPKFSRHGYLSSMLRRPEDFQPHHESYESLQKSLTAECQLCRRLWANFAMPSRTAIGKKIHTSDGFRPDVDLSTFSMRCRLAVETKNHAVVSITCLIHAERGGKIQSQKSEEFMFMAPDQAPLEKCVKLSADTGIHSSAIDAIKTWMQNCRNHHSACHRPRERTSSRSFARILDVGKQQGSPTVRLCESAAVPLDGEYMTLSHCWGGADIDCLARDRLPEYFEEILIEKLPQTFQDAIQLTRRLDTRYLWIDSFCIIQDSKEDWLDQSILMAEIYRGSCLNVAATRSTDPHGGLFVQRDPICLNPLRIPLALPGQNQKTFFDVGTRLYDTWSLSVANSKLCNRGWVIQERLLAPRVVHFASQQLFWECVESRAIEERPLMEIDSVQPAAATTHVDFKMWDPYATSLILSASKQPLRPAFVWLSLNALYGCNSHTYDLKKLENDATAFLEAKTMCYGKEEWVPTHPLIKYWAGIIATYCKARLSFDGDRLVAIAGLSNILEARTGIRYIAGHWDHQLPRQLPWTFVGMANANKNQEIQASHGQTFQTASWSWISARTGQGIKSMQIDSIVERQGAMDLIKVLSVETEGSESRKTQNSLEGSARLRLQGRLLPVCLDLKAWPAGALRPYSLVEYWSASTVEPPTQETFIVPVLFFQTLKQLPEATCNALILEATGQKGVFRRVGAARLHDACYLQGVFPQFYSLRIFDFGDDSDQIPEDASGTYQEENGQAHRVPPTPQQEFADLRQSILDGGHLRRAIETIQNKAKKMPDEEAKEKATRGLQNLLTMATSVSNHLPKTSMSQSERDNTIRGRTRFSYTTLTHEDGSTTWEEQPIPVPTALPAKDAVAPHYYLEYYDDEEASIFGHFIFDII